MITRDIYRIGRLFAQLTGQLEDATKLAVSGQNRIHSLRVRAHLVRRLRGRLARMDTTLDMIKAAIDGAEKADKT